MEKKYFKIISKFSLVIIFIVLVVLNFIRIDKTSHSASDTLRPFLFQTIILALILFLIRHTLNK